VLGTAGGGLSNVPRDLDGPDLHTPVVMAVRGPKAQALAADLAWRTHLRSVPPGIPSRADTAVIAAHSES